MFVKKQRVYKVFIFAICFCLSGCFTVSKSSKITSDIYINDKIKSIFILSNIPDYIHVRHFEYELKQQFKEKGIPCSSYEKKKNDLTSDKDIANMASEAQATHLMSINILSQKFKNKTTKTTFRIILINTSSGEEVWQGNLTQNIGTFTKSGQAKTDAETIMNELCENNYINAN